MIARPDLIMIGATGRDAGKTGFACALIRRQAASGVTAVKITVIRDGFECPRGGDGCGVCSAVEGRFVLSEERDATLAKDTGQMLRAGARRVLWLRVQEAHLDEGVAALLEQLPARGPVVCESNSARRAIAPGLFLILRPRAPREVKASAARWMALADRVVAFSGTGWDLDPEQCRFDRGRWFIPFDATVVILAGGQSRRMGQDKSLLPVEGQPLIARIAGQLTPCFPEVLVSSNDSEKYRFLGLPVIADETPGQGPLMGILSSLKAASRERVLVTACDIPVLDPAFIGELLRLSGDADIVMPVSRDGRREPLFAVYRRSVIPAAEAALARGARRVVEVLPGLRVAHPPMPEGWYHNLNTVEDLEAFRRA